MSSSVSYFRGAPITYCLCSTLFLGTLFTSLWERLYAQLSLESAQQVLSYRSELWRLLTSSMLLSDNLIAAGVTCFLLFQLRFFERQMGSSKFGAYVTLFTLLDMASRAGMLAIPGLGEHGVASGPFHLVFGLIPLYIRTVPVLHPDALTVLGMRFSEKTFLYVLCGVLAASDGLRSAWPSASGLLLGVLYAWPRSPLAALSYPRVARSCARAYLLPLLETPAAAPPAPSSSAAGVPAAGTSAQPRARASSGTWMGGGGGSGGAAEPSDAAVAQLVSMGFSDADAREALRASGGDLDAAVAVLVDSRAHPQ